MNAKVWRRIAPFASLALLAASCGSQAADQEATNDSSDGTNIASEDSNGAAEENPYEGETIEVLIPFAEGGGTDTWGRALVPYLEKHVGDDVSVVAFNDGGKQRPFPHMKTAPTMMA